MPTTHTTRKPIVLAITGRSGVGKDTVADILCTSHLFSRTTFAHALRTEIAVAFRIDAKVLTERATKEWPLPVFAVGMCSDLGYVRWLQEQGESLVAPRSPRWTMQTWGDYKRRYNPAHYADIGARDVGRSLGLGRERVCVTDLRYPVELDALRRVAGPALKVLRIKRGHAADLSGATAQHSSERDQDTIPADYELLNDGNDLAKLADNVQCILALMGVGAFHAEVTE